jgi:oligopeptide/dipeptide ABC transporter ATP-binding protein
MASLKTDGEMGSKILEVKNLKTSFFSEEGEVKAVDDVSFDVFKGKTLGIVGESGCGKSVTSLSIMRLIPNPPGRIIGGEILYKGTNLLNLDPAAMRKIRGNQISMIFQEPMTSLNPVFTIGNQIIEAITLHQSLSKKEARNKAIEMLKLVGIPSPEKRVDDYPHQLSGGMRQRVMIAMALSCDPQVLIADEPTTALDVTIQAQILDLLRNLQAKVGMGLILITHDLGVVAEMADEVVVMYAGRVVEKGAVREIFKNPKMPYTRGLLNSIPTLSKDPTGKAKRTRLETIPGIVPNLLHLPKGCRFQDRCSFVLDQCRGIEPDLRKIPQLTTEKVALGDVGEHTIRCVRDI